MLTFLIDVDIDQDVRSRLERRFDESGCEWATWVTGDDVHLLGIDTIIAGEDRLEVALRLRDQLESPRLVVVATKPTPQSTRDLLRDGADGVLSSEHVSHPCSFWALALVSVGFGVLPPDHAQIMANRLEEPPPSLGNEDAHLLSMLSTRTIEQAGRELGYSTRHTQRKYKALCHRFGFSNHMEASVAAARWGLCDLGLERS